MTKVDQRQQARRHSNLAPLAVALAVGCVLLALSLVLWMSAGVRPMELMEELAGPPAPWYTGAFTGLGVIGWTTAAVCLTLTAAALQRAPQAAGLRALGVLSAAFAADDLLRLHEHALPRTFGLPAVTLYVLYAVAAVMIVARHGKQLRSLPEFATLAGAVLLLALSVGIDLTELETPGRTALEEASKLLGISAWTTFGITVARRRLRASPG